MPDRHPILHPRRLLPAVLLLGLAAAAPGQIVDPEHPAEYVESEPEALECSDCHSCELPTHEDPCLNPCPRFKSHFVGKHQWDEGPEVVIIDQLADLYEPVTFSHRLHAEMSAMAGGCTNCHHYSEDSGTVPPCRECHDPNRIEADLRQPSLKGAYHRQCINCHLDWSHENACGFCHAEAKGDLASAARDTTDLIGVAHPKIEATPYYTYETPYADGPIVTFHHEDHVEQFGLRCVDCHQGDSCSRCHESATATRATPRARLDHVATCGSCHQERDCNFCHSNEVSPKFHHTETAGFHLDPYHTDVACKTCHGEPIKFRTPRDQCTSCHIHWDDGTFDHRVTGVVLDEIHAEFSCEDCHLDGNFAADPSCVDCHGEQLFPDIVPGERIGD